MVLLCFLHCLLYIFEAALGASWDKLLQNKNAFNKQYIIDSVFKVDPFCPVLGVKTLNCDFGPFLLLYCLVLPSWCFFSPSTVNSEHVNIISSFPGSFSDQGIFPSAPYTWPAFCTRIKYLCLTVTTCFCPENFCRFISSHRLYL